MQSLLQKGVSKDIILEALEAEYTLPETEKIKQLLEKKKYDPVTATRKDKERIYRFLLSRGFSYDDIQAVLKTDWEQ